MDFKRLHFVGVGGIGMSALAAMALDRGYQVSGSDRGAERPENQRIIGALVRSGLKIYPQDGSFAADGKADFLIYSSAIEEDNPDFAAAGDTPRLHRSQLLAKMLDELPENCRSIAVTGSCGKSSVTAYAAEALCNLGADASCLNGALVKSFITTLQAGNYRPGKGNFFVFESDESDKSLLNYPADYAIILNIGTDHYGKEELVQLFGDFLRQVRTGAILEAEVHRELEAAGLIPPHLKIRVFGSAGEKNLTDTLNSFSVKSDGAGGKSAVAGFSFAPEDKEYFVKLPTGGRHTALNALAVGALLQELGFECSEICSSLEKFNGVWRRNDCAGKMANGAAVYDDYAHNPEKIRANLLLMQEMFPGKIAGVFQPHGYGPFGFMKDALFDYLEEIMRDGDRFILLEPYYAGGTSSFSPHSVDVCAGWREKSSHPERYLFFPDRDELRRFLEKNSAPGDAVAIMGARDNTLSEYAKSLTAATEK